MQVRKFTLTSKSSDRSKNVTNVALTRHKGNSKEGQEKLESYLTYLMKPIALAMWSLELTCYDSFVSSLRTASNVVKITVQ